ncbi:MAG: FprA family A-type flavoprotein [Myxococcales bacterium]|nr:FprA family A-type flavoprotein [Myxococcales bacterium]MCB9650390.1 FprA family A-type flavoprotein [Deltaproteobacteria bacterium]
MSTTQTLFDQAGHKNLLLPDFGHGLAVQANQHLIIHGNEGMILDPGGHKVYNRVLGETTGLLKGGKLRYLFLSHQDPDIIAAVNGWLMTTDADAYVSSLWVRFVPHFGLDRLVEHRLHGIPDEGMVLSLAGADLLILPAHFLHSAGNFQVYDPMSKILYSGDLGASLGMDYDVVPDFDAHLQYMEGFHKRYMTSKIVLRAWVNMVRNLDIEIIAPQHGAMFKGADMSKRFIDWCESLECGVDLLEGGFKLPRRT